MNNVFILNGNYQYHKMFNEQGSFIIVEDVKDADLVCFTGGADVSPELYMQPKHHTTHNDPTRDLHEIGYFLYCVRNKIPMVGICRGGQFLHVMNGGSLHQDVDGHAIGGSHKMFTHYNTTIEVSSTHHQMMVASRDDVLLAYAKESTRRLVMGDRYLATNSPDSEVILHDKMKSLCFQPHPEFDGVPECRKYFFDCIEQFLL